MNDLYSQKDHHFVGRHKLKMQDSDEKILQKLEAMSLQMYESVEPQVKGADTTTKDETFMNIFDLIEEPYGNKIETKRIDLRPKSKENESVKKDVLSLENEMRSLSKKFNDHGFRGYSLVRNGIEQNLVESESSDDENGNCGDSLWIGRYRKTKLDNDKS